MAFDISTARPVGGFDPSTARAPEQPVTAPDQQQVAQQPQQGAFASLPNDVKNTALELAAGVNRGALALADIPGDIVNAVLELTGSGRRIPSVGDIPVPGTDQTLAAGTTGGFLPPGAAQQVVGTLGEFVSPAPPIAALSRTSKGLQSIKALDSPGVVPTVDDVANVFTQQSAAKQEIARKLAEDPANKNLVKFVREGADRVVKDKKAIETIKQGFDEGVIAAVKGASKRDRRKMAGMVDILKRGRENARFATTNRPSDIAGQSMLERINHIKKVNRESGKAVGDAARALKGQSVDITDPIDSFSSRLDEFGIRLVDDGKGGLKANFDETSLAPGDRGPIKEVIRQMSRIGKRGQPDALSSHELKRIIDRNVTFGKAKTGLSGDAERALKEFRAGLDGALDSTFPSYKKANDTFSETINALDSFQSAAGTNVDLFGPNADKAVGTVLRRLLSNTQSRANMITSIDDIEKVAKVTGGKFEDDVLSQVLFADELNSVFGPTARTSLAGEAQKAVAKGAEIAGQRGVIGAGVEAAGTLAERVRGINPENAIKSIEELLKR
jgi:hypothetical protein